VTKTRLKAEGITVLAISAVICLHTDRKMGPEIKREKQLEKMSINDTESTKRKTVRVHSKEHWGLCNV
jgi:hypothetical protein